MIWLLSVPVIWFFGTKALWLYAVDATLKQQRRMRVTFFPGDISEIEPLDGHALDNATYELQELGFTVLGDMLSQLEYEQSAASAAPRPPAQVETESKGIVRIFAHEDKGCYATLISTVAVTRFAPALNRPETVTVAPFRTVILSLTGTRDDDWSFGTHNREPQAFSILYRHPRRLTRRLVGADARQLLQRHLEERDVIAQRGGFRWKTALSLDDYQTFEEHVGRYMRGVHERVTTPEVAWKLSIHPFQKTDRWMGELSDRL